MGALLSSITIDPKAVVALASPVLTFVLNRFFSPSAKLYRSVSHAFTYLIQQPLLDAEGNVVRPTQTVQVASVFIVNGGISAAKNVEIVFNWKPAFWNMWPLRAYKEEIHPDNRYSIHIDSLAPKEICGIELLSVNADLPNLVNVRSEQGQASQRNLAPQIVSPKWLLTAIWILVVIGLISTVYGILAILEYALK